MIINTGQRTDIPAFYAEWFANRLKERFVCVRNPYNPDQVSRYRLDPSVVDVVGFCTKNPAPMFPYMDLLKEYGQYWFVTITPYGRDIEPHVPDKHRLLEDFKRLSDTVGIHSIGWRYDPIFLSERYTMDYHLRAFDQIAAAFTREPVEITFETYADAALYGETDMPDIAEEYADQSPKYGTVSDLESFDLGEPIRELRKEVTPDEDGERAVECKKICRYSVPDENVQHIEDLKAAEVSSAVVRTEDRYYESIPDDYLQDEDLEGMENWDGYMS